jgi:FAD/FMN-containing dehydrogenase
MRSHSTEGFSVKSATIAIPQLRDAFTGRVIGPGDETYDMARAVFYGGFDRRPAVIIRPTNADEVARVVRLAAETGLELAVRSGGHSVAGHSVVEGGIVLDLADMRAIDIDVANRTAWAQTGLTAGAYTSAAGTYGLATGFGDTGSVGIGGITLGGGIGYLARKRGLTIDNLLAAEVVTADQQLLRVDAENHPDLFWAIRGGGGNFAVATRFQYRLHKVPAVVGGMLILPATPATVADFIAEAEAAPDELSTIAHVMPAPPLPFLPTESHGRLVIVAMLCYAGKTSDGERALAPFRALATPIVDTVEPMPYSQMFPPDEHDQPMATARTMFVDRIDQRTAESIVQRLESSTAQMRVAQLRVLGGAVSRVRDEATAYAHRQRRVLVNVAALGRDPDDLARHQPWVDEFATALNQGNTGAYVGFVADEGPDRVRAAYPGPTWDRLRAIKASYDPTNLFKHNQNIPPKRS